MFNSADPVNETLPELPFGRLTFLRLRVRLVGRVHQLTEKRVETPPRLSCRRQLQEVSVRS